MPRLFWNVVVLQFRINRVCIPQEPDSLVCSTDKSRTYIFFFIHLVVLFHAMFL